MPNTQYRNPMLTTDQEAAWLMLEVLTEDIFIDCLVLAFAFYQIDFMKTAEPVNAPHGLPGIVVSVKFQNARGFLVLTLRYK